MSYRVSLQCEACDRGVFGGAVSESLDVVRKRAREERGWSAIDDDDFCATCAVDQTSDLHPPPADEEESMQTTDATACARCGTITEHRCPACHKHLDLALSARAIASALDYAKDERRSDADRLRRIAPLLEQVAEMLDRVPPVDIVREAFARCRIPCTVEVIESGSMITVGGAVLVFDRGGRFVLEQASSPVAPADEPLCANESGDPETRAFWEGARAGAREAATWPKWKQLITTVRTDEPDDASSEASIVALNEEVLRRRRASNDPPTFLHAHYAQARDWGIAHESYVVVNDIDLATASGLRAWFETRNSHTQEGAR